MFNSYLGSRYEHFDRTHSVTGNSGALYVYDYRDEPALDDSYANNSHIINTTSLVRSKYTHEVTEERTYWKHVEPDRTYDIKIQASANVSDYIPIELQEISRNSLDLEYYNVNYYKREVHLTDNYLKKYDEYLKDLNSLQYEEYQTTVPTMVMTQPAVYNPIFENGELKELQLVSPGKYEEQMMTFTLKRPIGPVPAEPEREWYTVDVYFPSSLDLIDNAMSKVSSLRSYFGAQQNRLEHAYANNKNTQENMEAGESRIRDTDMAEEMVRLSKENILQQAGQAILAQSLRTPEGVMRVLQ